MLEMMTEARQFPAPIYHKKQKEHESRSRKNKFLRMSESKFLDPELATVTEDFPQNSPCVLRFRHPNYLPSPPLTSQSLRV
jgi:hypothetical protein